MTVQKHADAQRHPPERRGLAEIVASISWRIARLDPGSAAALRRGPLAGAGVAAFWQLVAAHEIHDSQTEEWATVVQATAILTPVGRADSDGSRASAHEPRRSMGNALYQAGVSDQRFARLLAAKGGVRRDLLIRVCRRLSRDAEHRRFDLSTLAWFVVHGDETTDRRLARDYYRAEAAMIAKEPQTKEKHPDA